MGFCAELGDHVKTTSISPDEIPEDFLSGRGMMLRLNVCACVSSEGRDSRSLLRAQDVGRAEQARGSHDRSGLEALAAWCEKSALSLSSVPIWNEAHPPAKARTSLACVTSHACRGMAQVSCQTGCEFRLKDLLSQESSPMESRTNGCTSPVAPTSEYSGSRNPRARTSVTLSFPGNFAEVCVRFGLCTQPAASSISPHERAVSPVITCSDSTNHCRGCALPSNDDKGTSARPRVSVSDRTFQCSMDISSIILAERRCGSEQATSKENTAFQTGFESPITTPVSTKSVTIPTEDSTLMLATIPLRPTARSPRARSSPKCSSFGAAHSCERALEHPSAGL
mmetsp:Transcript_6956/g.21957  ORF Transcript_6956/g.21957 Transcript_6956/m.21957 type:complete len:339 (+) Transcript_6956:532-1548(+)